MGFHSGLYIMHNTFIDIQGKIEAVSSAEKLYMSKGDRERRGQLLGRVLLMQYPEGIKSISFEELLNWVLWPTFIRIYGRLK